MFSEIKRRGFFFPEKKKREGGGGGLRQVGYQTFEDVLPCCLDLFQRSLDFIRPTMTIGKKNDEKWRCTC